MEKAQCGASLCAFVLALSLGRNPFTKDVTMTQTYRGVQKQQNKTQNKVCLLEIFFSSTWSHLVRRRLHLELETIK